MRTEPKPLIKLSREDTVSHTCTHWVMCGAQGLPVQNSKQEDMFSPYSGLQKGTSIYPPEGRETPVFSPKMTFATAVQDCGGRADFSSSFTAQPYCSWPSEWKAVRLDPFFA